MRNTHSAETYDHYSEEDKALYKHCLRAQGRSKAHTENNERTFGWNLFALLIGIVSALIIYGACIAFCQLSEHSCFIYRLFNQ